MKRSCRLFAAVLVGAVSSTAVHVPLASAQAPGQVIGGAVSAPFLEKRVPDELASEGVVLSREGLSLQVEQIGIRWLVSLTDLNTGRVAASTKVDNLPPDREAAVAMMTHVVADLAAQVSGREPPPAAPAPPPSPPAPALDARQLLADERAEREARERAELKFHRRSLRFDASYELVPYGQGSYGLSRQWILYQGDLNQTIEAKDFYAQVGRPDLYAQYESRRRTEIGLYIAGGVIGTASLVFLALGVIPSDNCSITDDVCFQAQEKANTDRAVKYGLLSAAAVAVAAGTIGIGVWYHFHRQPITENEAKNLADGYNQHLRQELGLPVVSRREPIFRELRLAPYASGSGAGVGLMARF